MSAVPVDTTTAGIDLDPAPPGSHRHGEVIDTRPAFVLPAEIRVLGQRFRVSVVEHPTAQLDPASGDSFEALGFTDRSGQRIVIRGASVLSEDKARETLLHEVLHAVIGTARIAPFGDYEAEEALVRTLAPLLLETLRSNPELVVALVSR